MAQVANDAGGASYTLYGTRISESDAAVVRKYASLNGIPPELIIAVGWAETHWGQTGSRDFILGYGVTSPNKEKYRGFENQIRYGAEKLGRFFRTREVTYNNLLEFNRTEWISDSTEAGLANWARNVYNAYTQLTGRTGSSLVEDNYMQTLASNVKTWFNPEGKCYFTRDLDVARKDDYNDIDPGKFTPEQLVNLMSYDETMYGCRGRFVQAFPTYIMLFIDEGEWVGGRKLWDNFYFYHSLVSIEVVKDRKSPADTAFIQLTNVYGAINHRTVPQEVTEPQLTGLRRFIANLIPGITKHSIEMRKKLLDQLMVTPGARLHIRMGYGASASRLPVVFNGTIVEVNADENVTIVAQGDGHELLNPMIDFKPDDVNNYFRLGNEPVDIIRSIMADRGILFHVNFNIISQLAKYVAGDVVTDAYEFGASNRYGIEHFGIVKKHKPWALSINQAIETFDVMMNVYPTTADRTGELNTTWHKLLTQKPEGSGSNQSTSVSTKKMGNERSIGIWLGNKTPWDVIQTCAKATTGYISAVVPFQFRSTLFFGLPWWPMCIKYRRKKT